MSKTSDDIMKEKIASVDFQLLKDGVTTLCVITVDNGFVVTGKSSVVNKEHFNKELGEKYAYKQAKDNLMPFIGFMQIEDIHRQASQED